MAVRLRKKEARAQDKDREKEFKGSVFVTFKDKENAKTLMALQTFEVGKGEAVRKWQEEYRPDVYILPPSLTRVRPGSLVHDKEGEADCNDLKQQHGATLDADEKSKSFSAPEFSSLGADGRTWSSLRNPSVFIVSPSRAPPAESFRISGGWWRRLCVGHKNNPIVCL
jgi:hypothetical protein